LGLQQQTGLAARMIFANARVILPDRILPSGDVRVENGKIESIVAERIAAKPNEEIFDLGGKFLAPGFVDMHIHGALGRDTMEASAEAFETICKYHAAGGTTSLALTTVTASLGEILNVLRAGENFRVSEHRGAQVLGVHIEGPYFSREKRGAHRVDLIHDPVRDEYDQFLAHADAITQMTLAPELPGALELMDALRERGIRISGGHSDAWDEDASAAFAHGMEQVTHTFNCMSSARRRGPFRVAGLLEFAMSEPEILCELIADGRHVSPTLMRMLYHAKGPDGIALVTDATAGAGLHEGAAFRLAEIDCVVRDQVGLTSNGEALAGSTSNMIRLVRNMVELVDVSLVEAIRMATLNPARALGLDSRKGQLCAGADADLIVLSEQLEVLQTFVAGRTVFSKNLP
jgi:N-acetylglucosamine-6-phosphate deacetylase